MVLIVADDVDRVWGEIGRNLLHDAMTAASYCPGEASVASISTVTSVEELRTDRWYRIVTTDEAVDLRAGRDHPPAAAALIALGPDCVIYAASGP